MIVVGIILAAIGLLLIVAFLSSLIKCRLSVQATISKLAAQQLTLRGRTVNQYVPIFSYEVDGQAHNASASKATTDAEKYKVGQQVTIKVNPHNPAQIRFGSNLGFFMAGLIIAGLGAMFIVLSLI